jgi:hypothetical protein
MSSANSISLSWWSLAHGICEIFVVVGVLMEEAENLSKLMRKKRDKHNSGCSRHHYW